jgi:hypothetical protein
MENNARLVAGMFTGMLEEVAPDVARMGVVFVNLLGVPQLADCQV